MLVCTGTEEEGEEVPYDQNTQAGLCECPPGRQRHLSRATDPYLQVIIYLKMRVIGSTWGGVNEEGKGEKKELLEPLWTY